MKNNGSNNPLLKVEELDVSYYKKEILLGASLEVKSGEIVVLVGTNGSGKSTLLKTIIGLIRPNYGKIIFNGVDIVGKEPYEIVHSGVGFLMQGGIVFPSLSVIENLQLACQGVSKTVSLESIEKVWKIFPKLYTLQKKRAGLMSGGERQMLSFSMLLVQRAKLWLLDEPSGGLSPEASKTTMDLVRTINLEQGITVLFVEQNLIEAARIADRAYVLKDGKMTVEENPSEILNNGKLEEIFFK